MKSAICATCGKRFMASDWRMRYCSRECRQEAHRQANRECRAAKREKAAEEKPLPKVGKHKKPKRWLPEPPPYAEQQQRLTECLLIARRAGMSYGEAERAGLFN